MTSYFKVVMSLVAAIGLLGLVHGGIAFGLDRIAALMSGEESIRDVIAFPKTTTAQCLLTSAPSRVPAAQVAELHIRNLDKN